LRPEKLNFGGSENERKYAEKKIHKEGHQIRGILCAATSVLIIACVEDTVKVLALKCLNQYPYK
jgi:hypothetical protein